MGRKLKINQMKKTLEKACNKVNNTEVMQIASEYFDVDQVRQILHLKKNNTVYKLVHSGKIQAYKPVGKLLFKKTEILELLEKKV